MILTLASITDSITTFVGDHGVYAVFGLMLIDAVFPAFSELVMVYAGALAVGAFSQHVVLFGSRITSHTTAYIVMALSGTLGYLVGSWVGWAIGRYGGRPLLESHGRWLHLTPERLGRADRWFARWGRWAVLLGRITPIARSFTSIPAGFLRTPFGIYSILTLIGSAIWAFAFAAVGVGVGANYHRFHSAFDIAEIIFVIGAVGLIAIALWRRRQGSGSPASEQPPR